MAVAGSNLLAGDGRTGALGRPPPPAHPPAQAEACPAGRTVPAETTQAPDQQRRTPARRRQWPTPPPALRPRPGPASTTRALREFPTGPLPTSSQVRSSSSRPAPERLLGRTWTASKPPSLTARRFRRGAAGIAARARRCQAAWVSNQTEPRSWPAVRWTSALRAAARRRSRGDGGLGAAFLDALDIVLGEGGPQGQFGDGQAEGGADVVQGLAEGQGLAGSRAARDHQRVLRGAPSGCGRWLSHTCLRRPASRGGGGRARRSSAHGQRGRS